MSPRDGDDDDDYDDYDSDDEDQKDNNKDVGGPMSENLGKCSCSVV